MDIGSMAAALASMKTATDIATALLRFKTDAAVQSQAVDLTGALLQVQQQLLGAQMEQMSQSKRIYELETLLAKRAAQEEQRARYQLHQFKGGSFAFALRPELSGEEPAHYLCSYCYAKDQLVILQPAGSTYWTGYKCPGCETTITS